MTVSIVFAFGGGLGAKGAHICPCSVSPKQCLVGVMAFLRRIWFCQGKGNWGFSCPNFAGGQMTAKRVRPLHRRHITQDGGDPGGHGGGVYSGTGRGVRGCPERSWPPPGLCRRGCIRWRGAHRPCQRTPGLRPQRRARGDSAPQARPTLLPLRPGRLCHSPPVSLRRNVNLVCP